MVGGAGGRTRSVASHIVAKQEFAGYWEYLLDEAIFTHPAHPNWGGTGLISTRGELIGIGSLQLERERDGRAEHVNMIVPTDLLKPVLDDIRKFGRVNKPARPWLGMYTHEIDNRVVVVGIAGKGRRRAPNSRPATSSSPSRARRSRARSDSTASSGRSAPPASTCRSPSTMKASPSTWC